MTSTQAIGGLLWFETSTDARRLGRITPNCPIVLDASRGRGVAAAIPRRRVLKSRDLGVSSGKVGDRGQGLVKEVVKEAAIGPGDRGAAKLDRQAARPRARKVGSTRAHADWIAAGLVPAVWGPAPALICRPAKLSTKAIIGPSRSLP